MDITFVALAKRSAAYRAIRLRIARPVPSDSWYKDGLALVTFDLKPASTTSAYVPQLVFVFAAASMQLVEARVVEAENDK